MKVIIPMAGLGSRFYNAGYKVHKPLITVNDKSLIRYTIESLNIEGEYILVCRDLGGTYMDDLRNELNLCGLKDYKLIVIDKVTSGAAETALIGCKEIKDLDDELIITNCDQYLDWDSEAFLTASREYDGAVLTFTSTNPKNSFAEIVNDKVVGLVEKQAISDVALVGVHYWKHASYFVESATLSVKNFDKAKETYISETYNYLIKQGKNIGVVSIDPGKYWSTGTPEDLAVFKGMIQEYYTSKPNTYFIDLDGTILMHSHKYSKLNMEPQLCPGVREVLDEIDSRGDRIIIVSARKESAREFTTKILEKLMIPYDQLIMGVSQGCRVIINDNISKSAFPRAKAVNVITDKGWTMADL